MNLMRELNKLGIFIVIHLQEEGFYGRVQYRRRSRRSLICKDVLFVSLSTPLVHWIQTHISFFVCLLFVRREKFNSRMSET